MLKYRPCSYYPANVWKRTSVFHTLAHGNSYDYIVRDNYARPLELWKQDPQSTFPVLEDRTLWYVTTEDGQYKKLPAADVLHFRGLSDDGLQGLSLLEIARDPLSYGLALQKYGSVYFKNGGKPSVALIVPPQVAGDDEKVAELKRNWGSMQVGLDNAHKPAVVSNQTQIETFGDDNEQGQYTQSMETALIMVANLIGIPPHKVGAKISSAYNSLVEENQAFKSDSLDWLLTSIEEECNEKLLSEAEKELDTHYIEFLREGLLQIDPEVAQQMLLDKYHGGVMSYTAYCRKTNEPVDPAQNAEWCLPSTVQVQTDHEEPQQPPQQPPVAEDNIPDPKEDKPLDRRLEALTRHTVERLFKRVGKAVADGKIDMANHKEIFLQELSAFDNAEEVTETLFANLQGELEAVLPEQRQEVMARIDTEHILEELWK
jgi:HK97 family phage portal protein